MAILGLGVWGLRSMGLGITGLVFWGVPHFHLLAALLAVPNSKPRKPKVKENIKRCLGFLSRSGNERDGEMGAHTHILVSDIIGAL